MAADHINGVNMKILAYSLMVLFAVTGIPVFVLSSLILSGAKAWQDNKKCSPAETLHRSKITAAITIVMFVMVASALTLTAMIEEKTPTDKSSDNPSNQAREFVNLGWKNMTSSPPDYALAMRNNRSGYELNHPEGAANIGMLYENGWGVEKDAATAASWYQDAIAMDSFRSAQADYQLAGLYERGLGVNRDLSLAIGHYSVALGISTGAGHSFYVDERSANLAREALNRLNGQK